jgi:hypothetical protein
MSASRHHSLKSPACSSWRLDHVALADKKAGSKSLPNQLTDPYIIILA